MFTDSNTRRLKTRAWPLENRSKREKNTYTGDFFHGGAEIITISRVLKTMKELGINRAGAL